MKNKKGKKKGNEDLDTIMPATKVKITRSVKTSSITSPHASNILNHGGVDGTLDSVRESGDTGKRSAGDTGDSLISAQANSSLKSPRNLQAQETSVRRSSLSVNKKQKQSYMKE